MVVMTTESVVRKGLKWQACSCFISCFDCLQLFHPDDSVCVCVCVSSYKSTAALLICNWTHGVFWMKFSQMCFQFISHRAVLFREKVEKRKLSSVLPFPLFHYLSLCFIVFLDFLSHFITSFLSDNKFISLLLKLKIKFVITSSVSVSLRPNSSYFQQIE